MTITTIIRITYSIILLFNLWLIGNNNLQGIKVLILTFGLVFFVEYFIINNIPLEKLSEKELSIKIRRKVKHLVIKDIQSIQNGSKHIKYCYIVAASIIYIFLLISNYLSDELILSLFLLILGTLILGAFLHSILFLYIFLKHKNKIYESYEHLLKKSNNKILLINTIRFIDSKIKAP